MYRKEVIRIIQYHYLLNLSIEEKGDILLDLNRKVFNDELNKWDETEILKYKNNKRILAYFAFGNFVTNEYLEELVLSLMLKKVRIIDSPTIIDGKACVCCNYIIGRERELFSICPVCEWEVTNTGEDEYSGPNHSTLKSYREEFLLKKLANPTDLMYKMYLHAPLASY